MIEVFSITKMIEIIENFGLALLFGLGVAFGVLGMALLYRVYVSSGTYDSPLVITVIASLLLWFGSTFVFFVVVF